MTSIRWWHSPLTLDVWERLANTAQRLRFSCIVLLAGKHQVGINLHLMGGIAMQDGSQLFLQNCTHSDGSA